MIRHELYLAKLRWNVKIDFSCWTGSGNIIINTEQYTKDGFLFSKWIKKKKWRRRKKLGLPYTEKHEEDCYKQTNTKNREKERITFNDYFFNWIFETKPKSNIDVSHCLTYTNIVKHLLYIINLISFPCCFWFLKPSTKGSVENHKSKPVWKQMNRNWFFTLVWL